MRRPFIAANWKMHNTLTEARAIMAALRPKVAGIDSVDAAICAPYTLLYPMGKELDGTAIMLGAQNCYFEPKGAFTGEISAPMLKDAGCRYVIIGHSERRHVLGEKGDMLKRKVDAALSAGLDVIFCIGETLAERNQGRTQSVLEKQIAESLTKDHDPGRMTIAYEPVWAIGTGVNATAEQAQEAHEAVRTRLRGLWGADAAKAIRIQYGGSVKPGNATELLNCPDVDGALVGGASLVAEDFAAIIRSASALSS